MFNPQFDDARQIITRAQDQTEALAVLLNTLNPAAGGPGVGDAKQAHAMIVTLATEVHNLAVALGGVIDFLDQER